MGNITPVSGKGNHIKKGNHHLVAGMFDTGFDTSIF